MKLKKLGFSGTLILSLFLFTNPAVSIETPSSAVNETKKTPSITKVLNLLGGLSEFEKKQIDKCSADIAANPRNMEAYMLRGIYNQDHFPENAISDFSKVIELDPNNFEAFIYRAKVRTRNKQYSEALADYASAIKNKPDPDAYYEQGSIYQYSLKEPEKALPYYNSSIGLDPFFSKAYSSRAKAELDLGQFDKALTDFTKAIELDPRDWSNFLYRADVYKKTGQQEMADRDLAADDLLIGSKPMENYIQAIANNPENAGLLYKLADLQLMERKYQPGLDTLTRIIQANSKATEAFYMRGQCWDRLRNSEKAIEDYSEAIKLDPTGLQAKRFKGISASRSIIYEARASLLYTLGRNQQAIEDYSVAITFDPTNMSAWLGRGSVYGAMDNNYRSLSDKSQAIKLIPTNPLLWMSRGVTYSQMRQYENALKDYSQAIQIMSEDDFQRNTFFGDPKRSLADGFQRRGFMALRLGRKKEASADFHQAIALYPDSAKYIQSELKMLQY
ncbi:tetratricopeptide repeat protein [bacterium]|nr:tetratricopeptide repeat protein [bacterium]QQR57771.1 MAG: tetratricopeptide repeat protein [Candidatus Melainabacteria bacterium]